jgi:glycosyltransferase, family 1
MMRILHTIAGMSSLSGGPSTCTRDLLDGLNSFPDINADLLTVDDINNIGKDSKWLKEVPNDYCTPLCISSNLKRSLLNSDYDIYHCNALWMYVNHITCSVARNKRKPYVLSPHGMLYPTALKISTWKKKPMLWLWFNEDIHKAACLHATCEEEMRHCRAFGYKGPIAVIPNPVIIPEIVRIKEHIPEEKKIGFIGRLHPIKKVEQLLQGASIAIKNGAPSFEIDIMGSGDKAYEDFLQEEVRRLNLDSVVNFVGFVSGADKYERLSKLHALFVPSSQENFGMIVPEALICGTPVYASTGTPWEELNACNCGWWQDNNPQTIASIILEMFSKRDEELLQMGQNGRQLIEERYAQKKVAAMMNDLYKWILGKGEKPKFVYG